jgi:hypothetical protein
MRSDGMERCPPGAQHVHEAARHGAGVVLPQRKLEGVERRLEQAALCAIATPRAASLVSAVISPLRQARRAGATLGGRSLDTAAHGTRLLAGACCARLARRRVLCAAQKRVLCAV